MPDSTYVTAERFDKFAAHGLADEARDRKEDLRLGLQHMLWMLGHLKDAGVSADYLDDLAKTAHDAIAKRDAALNDDIDNAGQWAEAVDMAELERVIG
jgi:hypothetical protein